MTAPAHSVRVRRTLLQVLAEIMPDLPPGEIADHRTLKDLGADSVDRVEIITALTQRLGRDEPLSDLAGAPNLGALVERLSREADR